MHPIESHYRTRVILEDRYRLAASKTIDGSGRGILTTIIGWIHPLRPAASAPAARRAPWVEA